MFARLSTVVLAGALLAACATAQGDMQTRVNLIGSGLGNVEVFTPAYNTFVRADGSYCEQYQLRQYNAVGDYRYGAGTVCRVEYQQWVLVDRHLDPWPSVPAPVPSPSVPVPNPSVPVPNPSTPVPPPPPPSAPGQWNPVTY